MKATSRSTLPVLTRVIPRKAARPPALLMVLALLICLAALVAGAYAQTAEAAVIRDGTTPDPSNAAVNVQQHRASRTPPAPAQTG